MNIVVVTSSLNVIGGIEQYLRALLPVMQQAGHELSVAYEQQEALSSNTILDGLSPSVPLWNLGDSGDRRKVSHWNADIAFHHGLINPVLESSVIREIPSVLFAHSYYGTCISGTKCHTHPAVTPCTRRFGWQCFGPYWLRGCGGTNPVTAWRLYRWADARHRLLSTYRSVLVASRHMQQEFTNHGLPASKITVAPLFPPGVVRDAHAPSPRPRTNRVLYVGRLTPSKGWHHLLDAWPIVEQKLGRSLQLQIVGDGPDRATMETYARSNHLAVHFLGWNSRDGVLANMRQADLLVLPSLWPEPFGLVGVEAAYMGLPTAAYDTGGIREWLIPGQTGELAAGLELRSEYLAEAIVLACQETSHWQSLREGAWAHSEKFSVEQHLATVMSTLESALS